MNKIKEIASRTRLNIVASIYQDDQAEPPESDIVRIAYGGVPGYKLGTQACTYDELRKIERDIKSGLLVGVRVWAYIHSSASISTGNKRRENPYECPWDSGHSGWAYMTAEDARLEFGSKRLSAQQREKMHQYIDGVVAEFDAYLMGEVYGFSVDRIERDENGFETNREQVDACWGFYGEQHVTREALEAMAEVVAQSVGEGIHARRA